MLKNTNINTKFVLGMMTLLALSNIAHAARDNAALKQERAQVVNQYITDLKNADYHDITALFEKDGTVVSTSRGKVNAKDFFYSFLPEIKTADAALQKSYVSTDDINTVAARFHFSYTLKDGEKGDGEYVDEFMFTPDSAKLSAVYMYENLKFAPQSN
jgi:hypothetical protein